MSLDKTIPDYCRNILDGSRPEYLVYRDGICADCYVQKLKEEISALSASLELALNRQKIDKAEIEKLKSELNAANADNKAKRT